MKLGNLLVLLCFLPGVSMAATRDDSTVRVGVNRMSQAASHAMPNMSINLPSNSSSSTPTTGTNPGSSSSGGNTDTGDNTGGDTDAGNDEHPA